MSLEEKIGQKIMLDFRYWDSAGETSKDMTQPDEAIAKMLTDICSYTASKVKDAGKVETGIPLYGRVWGSGSVKSVLYNNVTQLKMLCPEMQKTNATLSGTAIISRCLTALPRSVRGILAEQHSGQLCMKIPYCGS